MIGSGRKLCVWLGGMFAGLVFVLLIGNALAGNGALRPPVLAVPGTLRPITPANGVTAAPRMSIAPIGQVAQCRNFNFRALHAGEKVPLSCFPPLPPRTSRNTASPNSTKPGRLHPMAATGATIDLTSGTGCGTDGAIYAINCGLEWQATNLADWSTSDAYEDYYVPPNATTATAITGTTYAYNAPTLHTTTLSSGGIWAFYVYDTTKQQIVAAVYADAGEAFLIGVYADPAHVTQTYQFDVNTSSDAYVYLNDVSTNDTYVVYVMSTSVTSYCVYLTPAATPQPGSPSPMPTGPVNNLICNPANSVGIAAPSGSLALTWPLNTNYQAGTYSIVVYDKTVGEAIGQVQVALTGLSEYRFSLYPTPPAAASPSVVTTPPTTTYAWDSTTEDSDAGVYATVGNQLSGSYRLTATDPDGQVVEIPAVSPSPVPATCTSSSNTGVNCTVTGTFIFANASPALNAPGQYPNNNIWTMQLIAPTTNTVEASQAFQIVGYSAQTLFNYSSANRDTITFTTTGNPYSQTGVSMIFSNTGYFNYPNAYDSLRGIEYTTGVASALTSGTTQPSNTTGNGVTAALSTTLSSCTTTTNANYTNGTGCSQTVTDSSGNSWTVHDYCSVAPSSAAQHSQCVLKLVPGTNVTLTGGANDPSITVPGMTFYMSTASACNTAPCTAITSILPQDGLAWSSTNTASPAWTQTFYSSTNAAILGTAAAFYIGSATFTADTSRNAPTTVATAAPTPWTNTHFYQSYFTQGDYQNNTPFSIAAGREDILVIALSDCNGTAVPAPSCSGVSAHNLDEIGITFPPGIPASEITVDPHEPATNVSAGAYKLATTGGNACNGTLENNAVCLNPGGSNTGVGITPGNVGQIWLDVPQGEASFIASQLEIQSWNNSEATWITLTSDGQNLGARQQVNGGTVAFTQLNSLFLEEYSLNSSLMSAQFDPSTVSPGATSTTYTLDFVNTSTAADPNPDPVDAIVVEQATNKNWTLTAPSIAGTGQAGWSNLSSTGYNPTGNYLEYWFGLCAAQYTNKSTTNPPQNPPSPTNPTAQMPTVASCGQATEADAIAPGNSMAFTFTLADNTTGAKTFYVYAHGANGGGWSAPKTVTATSSSETASAKFFSTAQGATDASCSTTSTVTANTVATVSGSPTCMIYEVTNTSGGTTQNIGTVNLTLPAYDINGQLTSVGPPVDWSLYNSNGTTTQYVQLGTISSGTFTTAGVPAGCTINAANTYSPTGGGNAGQIQVSGCTGFLPTDNIAIEFVANTPSTESNSYLFPATIDSLPTGLAWTGSDEITVSYSLGISVAVGPGNPGPGNSHPNPGCAPAQCAFSAGTLDFGQILSGGSVVGTDVVRATVIYAGATQTATCPAGAGAAANTWQLEVAATSAATTELTTAVDEAAGVNTAGLTYAAGAGTLFSPTATSTLLDCGTETNGTDYDTIMNFTTNPGTDTTSHVVTITYTVISG